MKGRGNNNAEHVEVDKRNNVMWRECRPERLVMQGRIAVAVVVLNDLMDRYEGMAWQHGLRDVGRNGVQGQAHAHGIGRLFRTARNSLVNLHKHIMVG